MKSIRLAAVALALIGLCACGKEPPEIPVTDSVETTTPAVDSLTTLRDGMKAEGCGVAVAFLGLFSGEAEDLAAHLEEGGWIDAFPFLADMDANRLVRGGGAELYLIVPFEADAQVEVCRWYIEESNDFRGATKPGEAPLYSGNPESGLLGAPILLTCNVSDIIPNTVLRIVQSAGVVQYTPAISLRDGRLNLPLESEEGCGVWDITVYDENDSAAEY